MQAKTETYELLVFLKSIIVFLQQLLNSVVFLLIRRCDEGSHVEIEIIHQLNPVLDSVDSFLRKRA